MKKKFTCLLPVFIWLCFSLNPLNKAKAQTTPVDSQTAAQLQAKLDYFITNFNLKGLSASVIIPGKGTWNGVSGISHGNVPIDTAMVFRAASITKNFTATAILLLQEEGLLSISDSMHEFLPSYTNIDSTITIQQLLQHTSGIYNYTANPNWWNASHNNPTQVMTPQFILTNYVSAPYFTPGTSYQYSNTNYTLLGLIIEQVSGQSYASFIRQRLLNPLQLTSLYIGEHEAATGVMPHNWTAPNPSSPGTDIYTFPFTSILGTSAAEAALAGNANDLAHWAQLLLTGQVLQDTSLQLMKQFLPINSGNMTGYGLGLIRFGAGNAQAWGHGGNTDGFASSLMFSPADSIVVSILSNKDSGADILAWQLLATARQQLVNTEPAEESSLPDSFACFPNPVQNKGTIRYSLGQAQQVEITLQNSLGQTVQTLLSAHRQSGEHYLKIDTSSLASGMYFCTLQTASSRLVQRWMITQ